MKKDSLLKSILVDIFPIIILFLFWMWYINKNNTIEAERELEKESWNNMPIMDIDISWEKIELNTGIEYTWIIDLDVKSFNFVEDCSIENTWEYKVLNVFKSPSKSPSDPKAYLSYTNPYTIIWNIEDAKLCIVSDVVDYRKRHQYTYSTYILFWDKEYWWHINVWYSPKTKVVYDKNSWWTKDLDGRFWGDEAPKIYKLNLSSLKVANINEWWTKTIYPLKRLQKKWNIRIWWFVNAKNWEGIIKKFVIAYRCEKWSNCSIK